jgi:hypothetical protein
LQGQHGGATAATILYKVNADPDPAVFGNEVNGSIPTLAGANSTYPMFNWTVNSATGPNAGTYDATNAVGTGIGGFNDWYMPAKNEYEILYRNLKPTTDANIITGSGVNPNAVPPTNDYTTTDPAQTTAALFQSGGGQDFVTGLQYWTATTGIGYRSAYFRSFLDGWSAGTSQNNPLYARAIRREFAYDTGILDIAQATFPNGLWWVVDRTTAGPRQLVDSVRGGNLALQSSNGNVETAYAAPTGNSVAWCWNAPDSFTSNAGTIPSSGRRNVDAGFSIVSYTGNNVAATVGHGLSEAPELVIIKNRDQSQSSWQVYHVAGTPPQSLRLETDAGWISPTNVYTSRPSSTVLNLGDSGDVTGSPTGTQDLIAYCWHSVPGYSSIGSYVGNGNADGPFIHTNFRVAFLLYKRVDSTGSWFIRDAARNPYNPVTYEIYLDAANAGEFTTPGGDLDLLSNGIKMRFPSSFPDRNANGGIYVYMAFAEHPFGGANVSPSPAR